MRRLIALAVLLLSCHHSFPPQGDPSDAADHDPDGSVDLVRVEAGPDQWRRDFPITEAGPLDLAVTADCGTGLGTPVVDATTPSPDAFTTDATRDKCSSLVFWSCKGCSGAFTRMVCSVSSNEVKREIWCDDKECRCKREGDPVPLLCLTILDQGRTGCKRCKSAFLQGCCNPVHE